MSDHRPWVLEVWETDPDTLEDCWRTWSTTQGREGALRIRDRLAKRGDGVRVRNSDTGLISCPHCNGDHGEPLDGSCLL